MTRPPKLVQAIIAAAFITIVSDVSLALTGHHATPLWGSGIVGFWAVFAVFWFVVFVFGSKWIGAAAIQKRENYYSQESSSETELE